MEDINPASDPQMLNLPPPNHVQEIEMAQSEATPKVEKRCTETTNKAIAAIPLSYKRPGDDYITIVPMGKVHTKTTEEVIAAVPILSHKRPADDAGTSTSSKKPHIEETTELEKPNNSTTDKVIAAVPLSHQRPGDEDITILPRRKRRTSETPEGWICEPKTRKNGVVDKYYRHEELNVRCRSLKEIERFVKYNIRPGRSSNAEGLDVLVEEMKKKPKENVEISSASEACIIQGEPVKQSNPVEVETTSEHQSKVSKSDEILQIPTLKEKCPVPMTTVKQQKSQSLKIVFRKNIKKKPEINVSTATAGDSSNKSSINTGPDQEKMKAKIEVEKLLADAWNNMMHLYDKKGDN